MVKLGKFGQSAKFGWRPCVLDILIIGIKDKITKQTVKTSKEPSHLEFHCLQMYVRIHLMSEMT